MFVMIVLIKMLRDHVNASTNVQVALRDARLQRGEMPLLGEQQEFCRN